MIKFPSVQGDYSLIWSGDSSLKLPEEGPERDRVLTVARSTGKWDDLIVAGPPPTIFHFRKIPKTTYEWLLGEFTKSSIKNRPLNRGESHSLTFRTAIRSIDNWGEHGKFKYEKYGDTEIVIASESIINAIGNVNPADQAIGFQIVNELAGIVLEKEAGGLSPL